MCLKSRGSKNETHSYDAPVCSLSVLLLSHKQSLTKNCTAASCPGWDFQTNTFQNSIFLSNHLSKENEHNEHIMMKNARNMYSKKTSNNENHTNTVVKLPHTRSRTSHHYNSYVVYSCTPHTCTIVPLCILHCAIAPPTSYRCSLFHPGTAPLHRTSFQKKNIAKKEKNIAKSLNFAMFFCFFAMFFV